MAKNTGEALDKLFEVIQSRKGVDLDLSYTAQLLDSGMPEIAKKLGEEAIETILAALISPETVVSESADLLYHLLVLWAAADINPADVWLELEKRGGVSGIAEKASRI